MRKLILILGLIPGLAFAWGETITANGNHPDDNGIRCHSGKGRYEIFDGGGGYDSGTVTFQFKNQVGNWVNACETAADCQKSSGNTGAKPFDIHGDGYVRFNLASVASAADIDVGIVCAQR